MNYTIKEIYINVLVYKDRHAVMNINDNTYMLGYYVIFRGKYIQKSACWLEPVNEEMPELH